MLIGPRTTNSAGRPKSLRGVKTTLENLVRVIVVVDPNIPPDDGSVYLVDASDNYFADDTGAFIAIDETLVPLTYTQTVTKSRSGATIVSPAYPNERVVTGPWLSIAAINDTASDYNLTVKATGSHPVDTQFIATYPADGRTDVRGFMFNDYGNYLDASATITPTPIKYLTTLKHKFSVVTSGPVSASNDCFDWFLFTDNSGTTAKIACEIQIYNHTAPTTKTNFLDTLTVVGTYTSAAIDSTPAYTWKVTYEAVNSQGKPYFQFMPVDGSGNPLEIKIATFDLKGCMDWLRLQQKPGATTGVKCLTGDEFYTGHGFGFEILNSNYTMNFPVMEVTYAIAVAEPATNTIPVAARNDITNAFWTLGGAPNSTATSLKESAISEEHVLNNTSVITKTNAAQEMVLSFDTDSLLGRQWVCVILSTPDYGGTGFARIYFDTVNNVIGNQAATGTFTLGACTQTVVAEKMHISIPVTMALSGTTVQDTGVRVRIQPASALFTNSYLGDTTKGLNISNISFGPR